MSDNSMPLVLDSLEIKNFRAFKHLRIEKLGRVNLIVGKNNVGKSSVLEALRLYAKQGDQELVWEILGSRDERILSIGQDQPTVEDNVEAVKYLFYGRQDLRDHHLMAEVGANDADRDNITIQLGWYVTSQGSFGGLGSLGGLGNLNNPQLRRLSAEEVRTVKQAVPYLEIGLGQWLIDLYSLAPQARGTAPLQIDNNIKPSVFIAARGITKIQIGRFWDKVTLTELEADVLLAMRLVSADIEGINLKAEKNLYLQRSTIVKVAGVSSPIPLLNMGEGMNRMFGIALALVNAKDGMLLIDEVDTGLHYSVLPDLWKLIFEVAHRLNVQVFATSHSWDCIQAFQQAAEENKEEEGVLIRLENRSDGIGAVTFDEEELSVVAREQIEVR